MSDVPTSGEWKGTAVKRAKDEGRRIKERAHQTGTHTAGTVTAETRAEVMRMHRAFKSNRPIGAALGLNPKTVARIIAAEKAKR